MNEDLLRRWVRRELPPNERRAVSRWVVECADPALAPLLSGMLQEQRDAIADRALASRPGVWQAVVDAWRRLLDAGRAELSSGMGPLVLASAGGPAVPELVLHEKEGQLEAVFRPALSPTVAAMFVTHDDGVVLRLAGPESGAELRAAVAPGQRTTVWGLHGPGLTITVDAAQDLARLLQDPKIVAVAVRYQLAQ